VILFYLGCESVAEYRRQDLTMDSRKSGSPAPSVIPVLSPSVAVFTEAFEEVYWRIPRLTGVNQMMNMEC